MYLNCHTYFSLRYGTLSVAELVGLAEAHHIKALALTDIHNTSACYDFVKACRKAGIHPVLGMEFRREDQLLYVALAKNLAGFQEINAFYSRYTQAGQAFPDIAPLWEEVFVIYPWHRREYTTLSDHEYLGIHPREVRQLLRSRYFHRQEKLVILQPITFSHKRGHNIHRLLRAVDHNLLLSKLMQSQQAGEGETFVPPDQLRETFADYPQLLQHSEALLARCSFEVDFSQNRTRQTYTGDRHSDMVLLEKLAYQGLEKRYGRHHAEARKRLESELATIHQLNFNAYFLITWDLIRYSQTRGFFHVGRGSGANSITAYCLEITDVDPIALNLYFERFLNPKRTSPPDFDIDYSWKDRDEVIDYLLKRYQQSHTAMIATYSTFQLRAAIRELGKVFGLPKGEIDQLIHHRHQPEADLSQLGRQVLHYAKLITGFPNHLSIHAGGILIAEESIHAYAATDLPPKGFPITHFDMYTAEEIGLHKFDVLSQRGLGHIQDALILIQQNQGKTVDIRQVAAFQRDPKTRELLGKGETIGCFYIESPAMRGLLRKLTCNDYLTLVAASSIIRPGVARSGMMQAYIRRHNGESFTYAHPRMQELLSDTYGIMVYQEDVIKVVHGYAGLSLADADMLRRAMSGKSRDNKEFPIIRERFLTACAEKGYPEATSQEIWRQIESFAGYSFSKAHSASFAVESFQSLYLRAHYPLEFITAVINNFGGFYDTEVYLHEARMLGAVVHAPCMNHSTYLTRLRGNNLWVGFIHLKQLEQQLVQQLVSERQQRGAFRDLADLARRVSLSIGQMRLLIRIGALRFTGKTKPQLLWEMRLHLKKSGQRQPEVLFRPSSQTFELPELTQTALEDAYDEIELLGFPLCSPFSLIPPMPKGAVIIKARDMQQYVGQMVYMLGYYVCAKTTATVHGDAMQFANFVDIDGTHFDTVRFPQVVQRYPFIDRGIYLLTGRIMLEFGHPSLEMSAMKKVLYHSDPRLTGDEKGKYVSK
ncbi:MAG: DNA polymerase III subunit alpha [Bacteroidota bacterium]